MPRAEWFIAGSLNGSVVVTSRAHGQDAAVVDSVVWTAPEVWPRGPDGVSMRSTTHLSESTYLLAPVFPSDPAFISASPQQRDARADELSAGRRARLDASEAAIHRAGF